MENVKITIEMTVAEFEALPADYVVGGDIISRGTGVTNIPASAKIGGPIFR